MLCAEHWLGLQPAVSGRIARFSHQHERQLFIVILVTLEWQRLRGRLGWHRAIVRGTAAGADGRAWAGAQLAVFAAEVQMCSQIYHYGCTYAHIPVSEASYGNACGRVAARGREHALQKRLGMHQLCFSDVWLRRKNSDSKQPAGQDAYVTTGPGHPARQTYITCKLKCLKWAWRTIGRGAKDACITNTGGADDPGAHLNDNNRPN